jgi:hypothetical protein
VDLAVERPGGREHRILRLVDGPLLAAVAIDQPELAACDPLAASPEDDFAVIRPADQEIGHIVLGQPTLVAPVGAHHVELVDVHAAAAVVPSARERDPAAVR